MDNLKEYTFPQNSETYYRGKKYWVPRKCPHCSNAISVSIISKQYFKYSKDSHVNIFLHQCPDCHKNFISVHLHRIDEGTSEFISCYPTFTKQQFSKIIEEFSPRFVEVYNQAYAAEQMNHLTLAGAGYRIALEILVKDFAISENKEDEERIKGLSLNNCIQTYYKDLESVVAAHVVRTLGNDHTHYVKKFDQVAFDEIKYYLGIFVLNIEMKLKIKNPPVPVPTPNQQT